LPETAVIDLPNDPTRFVRTLEEQNLFESLALTEEDKKRSVMYIEEKERNALKVSSESFDEFLKNLGMVLTIMHVDEFALPRVAQLFNKTNQFNLTTIRYTQAELAKMIGSEDHIVACIKVADRFGHSGIVGSVIVQTGKHWRIDSFLMSCRIMGRKIEDALMQWIKDKAKNANASKLTGEIRYTEKNLPVRNFYKESGFRLVKHDKTRSAWELELDRATVDYPGFLKINNEYR